MKAFLFYPDRDVDLQQPLPKQAPVLMQDLELETLFGAMARGDRFVWDVVKHVVLSSVNDREVIRHRQQILQDCLSNAAVVKDIYAIAVEAITNEKKDFWGLSSKYPDIVLHRSMRVLQMFVELLRKVRTLAETHADSFTSNGFTMFFAMLKRELDEDFFTSVRHHLEALEFRSGVLMSAGLGQGNKGVQYVLRKPPEKPQRWIEQFFVERPPAYSFAIADRDESGVRALTDLKNRGINLVANALAQSVDHILSFFTMVRTELAFYLGCLNLHEQLTQLGMPLAFPLPAASDERRHTFRGLYDICLALTMNQRAVTNDMQADDKDLVIITGANQGGKSTFLRSIGLAQLMMQCGMFVPAESFCANLCSGLFTHYKRKEDATMRSGKLDEELSRMSEIVDAIRPDALVLFNESFAATNEREGSEIARQITCALLEKRIQVFFVTHLYEFAHGLFEQHMANALFLRAERQADGTRTFKLCEGEPLQTSYGVDVYHQIFKGHQEPERGKRPF